MRYNTLTAAAIAAALAFPLVAGAAGDNKPSGDQSANQPSASGITAKADGGAEAMFMALDKNKDGFLTKEEVKGTPHEKEFSSLDTNHDGKLSRQEHAAAPEHAGKSQPAAAATGTSTADAKQKY